MDLKNIKATEHFITESKFRRWALASGIVKASEGSKSISGKSQTKGYRAELSVIKLLQSKNWILSFHGLRTDIAEVDLIFEKDNQVLLIEVKTLNNTWRAFQRIHEKQLAKLKKNFILFSYKFRKIKIRAFVAWVDPQNKITFVEVC